MAERTTRRRWLHTATFLAVCERDDWICQICHRPVDAAVKWPDPTARSPDHIIPLARGGTDEAANLQLGHLHCNQWKWARLTEEIAGMVPPSPGEVDPIVMALIDQARRAALRARALGRPWTDAQRQQFSLTMTAVRSDPTYLQALKAGQTQRRARERAGERPMFTEEGLQQSLSNLAKGWDPEVRARAIAASADLRRGAKDSQETRDRKAASARRAYAEGRRQPLGRKLTEDDVRAIRAEYRWGMARELAARYGVSPQLIQDVAAGRRWRHVA